MKIKKGESGRQMRTIHGTGISQRELWDAKPQIIGKNFFFILFFLFFFFALFFFLIFFAIFSMCYNTRTHTQKKFKKKLNKKSLIVATNNKM